MCHDCPVVARTTQLDRHVVPLERTDIALGPEPHPLYIPVQFDPTPVAPSRQAHAGQGAKRKRGNDPLRNVEQDRFSGPSRPQRGQGPWWRRLAHATYRRIIPARPLHLAVFGAPAIVANLFGAITAETAVYAGLGPVIALLVATIALDVVRPSSYTASRC